MLKIVWLDFKRDWQKTLIIIALERQSTVTNYFKFSSEFSTDNLQTANILKFRARKKLYEQIINSDLTRENRPKNLILVNFAKIKLIEVYLTDRNLTVFRNWFIIVVLLIIQTL